MAEKQPLCSIAEPPCGKPAMGRGWCSMHYATWRKYGNPVHPEAEAKRRTKQGPECTDPTCHNKPKSFGLCIKHLKRSKLYNGLRDPYERKFWAQVDQRGEDECWPWTGWTQPNGYGSFGAHGTGRTRLVHRIAYGYLVGPIPEGLVLDHLCHTRDPDCADNDNCAHRRCCNPAHLEPITRGENVARGRGGDSWGYVPAPLPPRPVKQPKPEVCVEAENGSPCGAPVYRRDLCLKHYKRWQRDPLRERAAPRTPEERFWEKVNKYGPVPPGKPELGPCWLWTAVINKRTGYGNFYPQHGVTVGAHRFSYELANGPIPEGCDVHHRCDVRRCCRPEHLQALTRSQNLAERPSRR